MSAVLAFLLNTRVGHCLIALALVGALLAGFRWKILEDARQREAIAAVQAQLAAARADLAISNQKAAEAHQRAVEIEAAARGWGDKVDALQRDLAAKDNAPAPVEPVREPAQPAFAGLQCPAPALDRPPVATDDDVKRLRAIAR